MDPDAERDVYAHTDAHADLQRYADGHGDRLPAAHIHPDPALHPPPDRHTDVAVDLHPDPFSLNSALDKAPRRMRGALLRMGRWAWVVRIPPLGCDREHNR